MMRLGEARASRSGQGGPGYPRIDTAPLRGGKGASLDNIPL